MKKQWWKNLLIFLAVMGPGIITAIVDIDAGGVTTYSLAGAHYGYKLIWSLIPITIALIVVQEMCVRMGIVTGKGLADLVRENYGVKITFFLLTVLLFVNFTNIIGNFAGIAAGAEIFGVKKYLAVPLASMIVWLVVVKGTYKFAERIFLGACVLYIAYIISGILVKPDWDEVGKRIFVPSLDLYSAGYITMLMGLIGTTIAPWMQFYAQASVVEKGVSIENYKYSKFDVISGTIVAKVFALFIMIACAATLYKSGMRIETAWDAAMALQPLAGKFCCYLFAFGLLNASLAAASIIPLSTTYSICEGMGWESGINKRFREAPQFYIIYTGLIVISALVVLIPNFPLILGMYISQVINAILLPFLLIFIILLVNKRELMGGYVNSKAFNFIAWATVAVMITLSLGMIFTLF